MDSSGFKRVREAFEAALALPADERLTAVQASLSDAPELLAEAERMLAAHASDAGFLRPPSAATLANLSAGEPLDGFLRPGERIGDFELVRPIGAGGMGEVWEARQENPGRSVALKALRAGLRTDRGRRRFREESEVLARLAHPGIAQVLASGTLAAPDGGPPRPWFAMELIEGAQPLTEYARDLPLRRRLLLLREACVAIHHGHLRGVVHRDIKPDNLLVDSTGRVRVIDFGIARAAGTSESELSLTGGGELLGTLAYMSPEQVRGETDRIDVRTDVHALGVVLYELLTGASPWRRDPTSWTALAREVCDADPPPPSRTAPGLSPELDWIVARALAKESEHRYGSAQELADEVGRFLDHQPLVAGPPGLGYAARKFARRHRPWVVGGAVAGALLILGSAGTSYGLLKSLERGRELEARGIELEEASERADLARADAETARLQAEDRLERAETINRFLDRMLRGANPMGIGSTTTAETTVAAMLDRAAAEIDAAFPGKPGQEADSRLLIGTSYFGQGRYADALEHLTRARDLFAELLPEREFEWVRASRLAAAMRGRLGDVERSAEELRAVRDMARERLEDDYPELAAIDADLAWALQECGELAASVPFAEAARDAFVEYGPEFAPMAASAASHLARATRALGDDDATEAAYRSVLTLIEQAYGPDSVQAGIAVSNLGTFIYSCGRNADARELFVRSLEVLEPAIAADHPTIATTLFNLAAATHELGDVEEAERLSLDCLAMNERLWGPDHAETTDASASLGMVQYDLGRFEAARASFERAAEFRTRTLGWDHRRTLSAGVRALDATIRSDADAASKDAAREQLEELYQHCLSEEGPDGRRTRDVARIARRAHAGHPDFELWDERCTD